MVACSSDDPLDVVVPECLVEVMESFDGEYLMGAREGSIR